MRFVRRQLADLRKHGISVLARKAMTGARVAWYFVAGSLTILACVPLLPLRRIRFGHVYSTRIGHLVYNLDNYLSARRSLGSAELAFFSTDEKVASTAMLDVWKRQPRVVFTQWAYPAWWVLTRFFPDAPFLVSWGGELHPVVTVHSLTPSLVSFTPGERERGEAILAGRGITRPFVCFHSRDSAYLRYVGGDGNPHDFRDFDFADMGEGIERVLELGYSAVRLGAIVEDDFTVRNPRYINHTGEERTDFGDLFLVSECAFFVGCSCGFSHLSRLFRKPELLVNFIPLKIPELSGWAAGSLLVPKKLYSDRHNRLLRISEMAALPYDIHYKGDFFGDRGISVINNSSAEIANAVAEMEARIGGRWMDSQAQQRLQLDVKASLRSTEHTELVFDKLRICVASTFLESNPELI